jgi:hemoglobin
MAELEGSRLHGGMGRRGFLKTAGGIAVFGGAFILVGCGDDDEKPAPTTQAVGTAPATASTTAAVSTPSTAATATSSASGTGTTASLYTRLGGEPAIQAVINDFLTNVAADTRINHFFAKTDLTHLNMALVTLISQSTGGPDKYTGKDMKTAHAGMMITTADFNALVEDLTKSLTKLNVPTREQSDLLALLGPMKSDIVTA